MTRRRFSIWRILFALVLLAMAVLIFTTWRRSAILLLYGEEFVGFDEPQGLFYTTSKAGQSQELHCYELTNGAKRSIVEMQLPSLSDLWPCQFTPDKRHLIAVSGLMSLAPILRMSDLQPVQFDTKVELNQPWLAMRLSPDGKTLLFLTYHDHKNRIGILDLEKRLTQEFTIHVERDYHTPRVGNDAPDHAIDMTADHRLVAFCSTDKEHVIYDLSQNQVVLREKADGDYARFSTNGQRVAFLSEYRFGSSATLTWYELRRGRWEKTGKKELPFPADEKVCQLSSHFIITACNSYRDLGWLERLPGKLTNYLDKIVPHQSVHIRYWDFWTGEPLTELSQEYPSAYVERYTGPRSTFGSKYFKQMSKDVAISSDGRYLVWNQEGIILSLWETKPRSPFLYWLICSGLVFLAVWMVTVRHQPREQSIPLTPPETDERDEEELRGNGKTANDRHHDNRLTLSIWAS